MCKKGHGSFKEYAQRWRDLAAQVAPQWRKKKTIANTLPTFYYEKMVGYTPSSFADLVFIDERIKVGMKKGKFNHPAWTNEKTGANEEDEKEEKTHAVTVIPIRPSSPPAQHHHYSANISYYHYPPPIHPQRPSLNQPQSLSTTFFLFFAQLLTEST